MLNYTILVSKYFCGCNQRLKRSLCFLLIDQDYWDYWNKFDPLSGFNDLLLLEERCLSKVLQGKYSGFHGSVQEELAIMSERSDLTLAWIVCLPLIIFPFFILLFLLLFKKGSVCCSSRRQYVFDEIYNVTVALQS